jgi:hypothetical protein
MIDTSPAAGTENILRFIASEKGRDGRNFGRSCFGEYGLSEAMLASGMPLSPACSLRIGLSLHARIRQALPEITVHWRQFIIRKWAIERHLAMRLFDGPIDQEYRWLTIKRLGLSSFLDAFGQKGLFIQKVS